MGTVLTFSIQKGGVAKTTSCRECAAILGARGHKVLVVDMDGQRSLTQVSYDGEPDQTIVDVLSDDCSMNEAAVHLDHYDLVAGDRNMYQVELMADASIHELRNRLREARESYDYILLDAPPSLGKLQFNCIAASDYVIIPVMADLQSYNALGVIMESVQTIRKQSKREIRILGAFFTMYEGRSNLTRQISEVFMEEYPELMMETRIRQSVKAREAQAMLQHLIDYAPRHNLTKDYEKLVDEMLQRMKGGEK